MEDKPLHFDGSVSFYLEAVNEAMPSFELTNEMRKRIGQNPYSLDNSGE
ncbi:hypothetical protein ACF5W4_09625 [Bacillota bacterium Lsc_1132]